MLNISIFIYFWANKIKNVFKLNRNSVRKKNILKTSETENCFFLRMLNLGLNVVLIKKSVLNLIHVINKSINRCDLSTVYRLNSLFSEFKKDELPTDGRTDKPSYKDAWALPEIIIGTISPFGATTKK